MKALIGDVQNSIKEMNEDLEKFNPSGKKAERVMEDRVRRYKELKERVENYEVLLSGTAEDLKVQIDELTRKIHAKLVE